MHSVLGAPVVCPDDVKDEARRQVSAAEQPRQSMVDGGAPRRAEARIDLGTLQRAQHVSPRRGESESGSSCDTNEERSGDESVN